MASNFVEKRTSPPRETIWFRRFFTTCRSRSVPTWGLVRTPICSGAPQAKKVSSTVAQRGSLDRAVSFPSEKVPAPPSPKRGLLSGSARPVRQ